MIDLLTQMMDEQLKLQLESYGGEHPSDGSEEQRIEFIRWNTLALTDELHEALAEVGWKPWASNRDINREAYVGELVDAWHFLMNLLLVVEVTPDEFYRRYMEKRYRNAKRQREGYDGIVGKCPSCKRALDDDGVDCQTEEVVSDSGTVVRVVSTFCSGERA